MLNDIFYSCRGSVLCGRCHCCGSVKLYIRGPSPSLPPAVYHSNAEPKMDLYLLAWRLGSVKQPLSSVGHPHPELR